MANEEQVALLKQGALAWNAWRDRNLDIRPNLRGRTSLGRTSTGRTSAGRTSAGRPS
jgi:hypothetical protein